MDTVFDWSQDKNQKLITERGISFEAIISYIEAEFVIAVVSGQGKFKHQKQFIIEANYFIYVVSYVENDERIFLKTIIPSRKLTKKYLSRGE